MDEGLILHKVQIKKVGEDYIIAAFVRAQTVV
jgi:hypothetical protein